jgi:hypothetical protein
MIIPSQKADGGSDGSFDASLLEASNFWIAVIFAVSEKSTSLTHHAIDSLPRSQRE